MYPRWHILFGAIFTLIFWYFAPSISWLFLALLFLSSFLTDFDHYAASVIKTGKISLKKSFHYHKLRAIEEWSDILRNIKRKSDFHLFHTVEFHLLIGILAFFWVGFFYIFIGMVFHSILDVIDLFHSGTLHRREFFFFNWLKEKKLTNQ